MSAVPRNDGTDTMPHPTLCPHLSLFPNNTSCWTDWSRSRLHRWLLASQVPTYETPLFASTMKAQVLLVICGVAPSKIQENTLLEPPGHADRSL